MRIEKDVIGFIDTPGHVEEVGCYSSDDAHCGEGNDWRRVLPRPTREQPMDERELEGHISTLPDSVMTDICWQGAMPAVDFAKKIGRLDDMVSEWRGYKSFVFPFGVRSVRQLNNRWQIGVYSLNGLDSHRNPCVAIRDLCRESGFPSEGLLSTETNESRTSYVIRRAFAGVRLQECACPYELMTSLVLCDTLHWRGFFPIEHKARHFVVRAIEKEIGKNAHFNVSDGRISFHEVKTKGSHFARYRVTHTRRADIPGFSPPLIGHGWSREFWRNRPSPWCDVVIDWRLGEVAGSLAAVP